MPPDLTFTTVRNVDSKDARSSKRIMDPLDAISARTFSVNGTSDCWDMIRVHDVDESMWQMASGELRGDIGYGYFTAQGSENSTRLVLHSPQDLL